MHRSISQRKPFLMLIEPDLEGGGSEDDNPGEGGKEFAAITSQEAFDAAIKERLARERSKYADYDDIKAKAAEHDKLIESQKTEAQKAIDAAVKRAEEAEASASKTKREAALTIAGVPEDEWDDEDAWHHGLNASQIKKIAASMSARKDDEKRTPPRQRGRETFVGGNGRSDEPDETDPRKLAALIRGE